MHEKGNVCIQIIASGDWITRKYSAVSDDVVIGVTDNPNYAVVFPGSQVAFIAHQHGLQRESVHAVAFPSPAWDSIMRGYESDMKNS